MKTLKVRSTLVIMLLSALFVINATAQRGQMRMQDTSPRQYCLLIPDLTEEQEEKLSAMRTEQIKESTQHRAQMDELRARKRSLMITASPDSDELNTVIDQMTELRNKQLKSNVAHRQQIREQLTEEQRVYFDSSPRYRSDRRPAMREGQGGRAGGRGMSGRGMHRNR